MTLDLCLLLALAVLLALGVWGIGTADCTWFNKFAVTNRPDGSGSQSVKVPQGLRRSGLRQNNLDGPVDPLTRGTDRKATTPAPQPEPRDQTWSTGSGAYPQRVRITWIWNEQNKSQARVDRQPVSTAALPRRSTR